MKKYLVIAMLVLFIPICVCIYLCNNYMDVIIESILIERVDKDTYLDACIKSSKEKEKIYMDSDNYYSITINATIVNNRSISYSQWRCLSKHSYDNIMVWIDSSPREGDSIINSKSQQDGVGLGLIVYAKNTDINQIKSFIENDLRIVALGVPVL